MTLDDQQRFAKELLENVSTGILADLHKVPAEWDGHELRRFIAHRFNQAVFGEISRTRLRAFNHTLVTKNL